MLLASWRRRVRPRDPDRRRPVRRQEVDYVYDLGACWEHEITLEKTLALDPGGPTRVLALRNSPVEYPEEDYGDGPEEPEPFDLDEVNRPLAGDEDY